MSYRERRSNRSAGYQSIFNESSFPHEMLESFSNDDSIYKKLNPFAYDENIMELQEQLKKEFWRVVNTMLTPRQRDVIRLRSEGKTQIEIAKELGVNQSSITKSLNGNVDYKNGKRSYGGSLKRIKKLIDQDEKIQEILKKIAELKDESWV